MTGKADFTAQDWARVVASPMVAGMAITAADPSGLWGLLKEAMAGGWSLVEAKRDAGANPLARAIAEDIDVSETRTAVRAWMQEHFKGVQAGDLKSRAVAELREVSALVEARAPADAPGFRSFLMGVARKAAEAGNEGGFLGFGGVAVSEAEKATLDEIAAALGVPGPTAT